LIQNKINLIGNFEIKNIHEKEKLGIFLKFLKELSYQLILNSPEYSLIEALKKLNSDEKKFLNLCENGIKFQLYSLESIIEFLFQNVKSNQISILKSIIKHLLYSNSKECTKCFTIIAELINNQIELSEEQEILIKSSEFKINLIKIVVALTLGILSPFLINLKNFMSIMNTFTVIDNQNNDLIYIFIIAGFFLVSLYFLDKLCLSQRKKYLTIISLLIFIISIIISSNLASFSIIYV
jgi:hypothetical protein